MTLKWITVKIKIRIKIVIKVFITYIISLIDLVTATYPYMCCLVVPLWEKTGTSILVSLRMTRGKVRNM